MQTSKQGRILRGDYKQGNNILIENRILLAKRINEGIAPPEEMEPGVLLKGKVHAIFGSPDVGKSMLLLALLKEAIEGSTTKEVFEAYVEHFLAPTLREGQVVVMDNLSAHNVRRPKSLRTFPKPRRK
jgi:hypothetical protein